MSPVQWQAIIWTNANLLSLEPYLFREQMLTILFQENEFQNVVCKIAAILSASMWYIYIYIYTCHIYTDSLLIPISCHISCLPMPCISAHSHPFRCHYGGFLEACSAFPPGQSVVGTGELLDHTTQALISQGPGQTWPPITQHLPQRNHLQMHCKLTFVPLVSIQNIGGAYL